jgi:hypothetical protein
MRYICIVNKNKKTYIKSIKSSIINNLTQY